MSISTYYKKRMLADMVSIGNFLYICPLMCSYSNTNLDLFIKHFKHCQSNLTQTLNINEIYMAYKYDNDSEDNDGNDEETYTVKDYVDRQTSLISTVRNLILTDILSTIQHEPFERIRQFIIDKLIISYNNPNRYLYWDLFQIYCFFFDVKKEETEIMLRDMIPHEI